VTETGREPTSRASEATGRTTTTTLSSLVGEATDGVYPSLFTSDPRLIFEPLDANIGNASRPIFNSWRPMSNMLPFSSLPRGVAFVLRCSHPANGGVKPSIWSPATPLWLESSAVAQEKGEEPVFCFGQQPVAPIVFGGVTVGDIKVSTVTVETLFSSTVSDAWDRAASSSDVTASTVSDWLEELSARDTAAQAS